MSTERADSTASSPPACLHKTGPTGLLCSTLPLPARDESLFIRLALVWRKTNQPWSGFKIDQPTSAPGANLIPFLLAIWLLSYILLSLFCSPPIVFFRVIAFLSTPVFCNPTILLNILASVYSQLKSLRAEAALRRFNNNSSYPCFNA